jgi:hypothetical protein
MSKWRDCQTRTTDTFVPRCTVLYFDEPAHPPCTSAFGINGIIYSAIEHVACPFKIFTRQNTMWVASGLMYVAMSYGRL